jgi:hypothetical protein
MRTLSICAIVLIFTALAIGRDESLDELKAHVERASASDRAEICVRIAELELRIADKSYVDGDVEKGRAAVEDIASYSEKARDSAIEAHKHLKGVEIAVRKISDKLKDIKRTLAFEDQAPVEKTIERLEAVRTSLLKDMFKKEKK